MNTSKKIVVTAIASAALLLGGVVGTSVSDNAGGGIWYKASSSSTETAGGGIWYKAKGGGIWY